MQIDNGGNFLGSSTPLDINQKWQVIKEKVGLDNTDDYYTFKLSNRSSFNLVLSNLSDNADVRLLNDNGSEIAKSSAQGTVTERINQILDSGSYHIHVHQVGNTATSYNLRIRSNHIPQAFQFNTEAIAGGVRLIDTKVFDADGVNDIGTVDFWLKKQGESWKKFGSVSEFSTNTDGSIGFNYDISNLEQGKYHVWGRATDKFGARSNAWTESFNVENIVNIAPQNLGFTIEQISGGVNLTNTKVFDANGIDDLERVDFQLKKEGGEWVDIKDALNFYQNQDGSIGFNYGIRDLKQGNYELKAIAYDQAGASGDALTSYFKVNNLAPSNFEFDIEAIEGGVRVLNGKVFDANGIDDLNRVDFWLQKQGGNWQNIADAVEFHSNGDGTFGFDYSIDSLEAGNYVLWARTRDKIDDYSNIWQKSFQVVDKVSQLDWFDQNIQDTSIRELSRSLFSDNIIDRNDAIAILRDAKDDSVVDSTELNDLRTIINHAYDLGIAEYVRVLSNKVVNGDVANKSDNLQAGSSDVQLERLINKWFLGSERPITTHTYRYTEGSLFQNGISHDDIKQGYINDCFFLAGLGATVVQSPEIIQNMFIDNGDGSFTVRFYNKGVADYVTVDRYLPTNNIGNLVYANAGDYHGSSNNELWVALAEKAYAQLNESGWINQDNTNSYNGIGNAGYLSDAFTHITGEKSALGRRLNFNTVIDAFSSGEVVGFGSKSNGVESNIVASHAYALIDYNATTQKFTLLNPWSTDNSALKSRTLELSWNDISNNFSYWDSTIKNVVST
ncbi:MAG: C2 family cysteine protease [Nostocales cyanobacterium 94392]|nr:C2 family cysteine protease [Nostocales cyanobacterium 94392]